MAHGGALPFGAGAPHRGAIMPHLCVSVPVDVGNFEVLRYNNNEGFRTKINDHVIDSINIILEDDKGSEIDINNHWSITLEFNKVINVIS